MAECIFCQIVEGKKPAYKLYEDDHFLAFLDLYPYGVGHTLVIPKLHYRWIWDVPDLAGYMQVAKQVALHLQDKLHTHTVYSLIFGEQVPHAHIHLLPPLPQTQLKLKDNFLMLRDAEIDPDLAIQLQQQLKLN